MNNSKKKKESNFQEIHAERLLLRRLEVSDWEMISYLRSDKEVNEFVKRPSAATKDEALKFIARINRGIEDQKLYYWAITEKDKDHMIGSICLWNFSEDEKVAEVGYDLSLKCQGKGIMNESLQSILTFGFNELNLDTIEAYTHIRNESSKKLLERNMFTIVLDKKDEYNEDNIVYEVKKTDLY